MLIVNIAEAKAKLSEFLDAVSTGERVLICKRNRPVAELRAVESARTAPRPIGLGRQAVTVSDSFFEPLPHDVIGAFYGNDEAAGISRVAERPSAAYQGRKPAKGGQKQ